MKYIYVVTTLENGTVLGKFNSQRQADRFVFSDECKGISTRTTRIKKCDYVA